MLQAVRTPVKPDTLIRNPETRLLSGSTPLPVPARTAWGVVGNFAGFDKFITGLERIEMTGEGVRAVRKKFFADGNVVLEQLNSHDDDNMVMTWTLLYTSFDIGNLWAAMRVEPVDSASCTVTWDIRGEPWNDPENGQAAFDAFIEGFLDMAMSNLRKLFS